MLVEGATAYPGLTVDDATYLAYLGERTRATDPPTFLARVDAAELYLVVACSRAELRAQQTFERAYFDEVRVGASRLACVPDELDEVRQGVRTALFSPDDNGHAKLLGLAGRGNLRALIRLIALRTGISLRRKRKDVSSGSEDQLLNIVDVGPTPSLALVKHEHRARFREALQAALATLDARQRTLMRLHELDGVSHARLATMYHVDRSTVTRWLARARADVLTETRRQLTQRYGVTYGDFDSFVDVIRSNFTTSVYRMLGE